MVRPIEHQLYKITHPYGYGRSIFVESDNIDDVMKYVAEQTKAGNIVSSINEINLDGSHPKIAINQSKTYKNAMKIKKEN